MTEVLIVYLSTVIISKVIDKINVLIRLKDLTDAGYKLKNERIMEDIHKELVLKNDYYYIPFYNIYDSLKSLYEYQNCKSDLLYQEYSYDRVEELNPREKKKYEENPTLLNAWLLEYKMENIREKCSKISLSDGSIVYYKMSAEHGLEFVDCIGPSQNRDENYLKSILIDGYTLIIDEYKEDILNRNLPNDELVKKLNDINEVYNYLALAKEKLNSNNKVLERKK